MTQPMPLATALAVALSLGFAGWTPRAQAESIHTSGVTSEANSGAVGGRPHYLAQIIFNSRPDPADGFAGTGRPVSRTSGGSRGTCDDQLIALLPGTDSLQPTTTSCLAQSTADLALTTTGTPTLWFHGPTAKIPDTPIQGELALLDADQRVLSMQTVTLPTTASIVGIQLDTTLDVDRTYHWVFSLDTHPQTPSENPRVEGYIRRVTSTAALVTALDGTEDLGKQAEIWANHGIWHEALSALAHQQRTGPSDTSQRAWTSLLDSVGLGAIANTPLSPCCQQHPALPSTSANE